MNKQKVIGFAALMMVFGICSVTWAKDEGKPDARAVITKVTSDAIAVLRDPNLTREQKSTKVREIALASMDFESLSRLAMGQYWRSLTDAQKTEFMQEFRRHVAATYGHTTDEYTDEDETVVGDRQEERGDWIVLTSIRGTRDGVRKEVAKVDYRLRQKNGDWKIIDVTIDGVSLALNFRSQFGEIMANGGYDRLIKMLREKNAASETK